MERFLNSFELKKAAAAFMQSDFILSNSKKVWDVSGWNFGLLGDKSIIAVFFHVKGQKQSVTP